MKAISAYVKAQSLPLSQAMVRLDDQYGNGTIVADLAGLAYVMWGKDYSLLDGPEVQARLAFPPDQQTTHPEKCRVNPSIGNTTDGLTEPNDECVRT